MSDRERMTYEVDGEEVEMIEVPNPAALRAGVKHIEDHIDMWSQTYWVTFAPSDVSQDGNACGTTACLAGHILLAAGYSWNELNELQMPGQALDVLGFDRSFDSQRFDFDSEIFCYIHDYSEGGDENVLAYTPEKLAAFKAWVTKVTGVTFDE